MRAREEAAERDLFDVGESGHGRGRCALFEPLHAELAVAVVAPAPDRAIAAERAGEAVAHVDGADLVEPLHGTWCRHDITRAARLAIAVVSPAAHRAARAQAATEVGAERERDRARLLRAGGDARGEESDEGEGEGVAHHAEGSRAVLPTGIEPATSRVKT